MQFDILQIRYARKNMSPSYFRESVISENGPVTIIPSQSVVHLIVDKTIDYYPCDGIIVVAI